MRLLVRILITNTAIALLMVLTIAAFDGDFRPSRWIPSIFISGIYSISVSGLALWIMPKCAPRIAGSSLVRWAKILGLFSLIALAGGTIAYLILTLQPFFPIRMGYASSMLICLLFSNVIGSVSYIIEHARHQVQASSLELRTRELERERALKAAADAKLQSLESRVHPHFLFNTLNSISSLVRSNPAQAEALIENLAALLRFSLDRQGRLVSLEDELRITRGYLEIEKTRFDERLQYHFDVPQDLHAVQVPALSLQTLTENSVKYAVGALRSGARIEIRVRELGSEIEFEVRDTGPGFSPDSLPAGHGLDMLRQRLEGNYGAGATLKARRLDPGMEVTFRIPC
ncbi:sensor histidine kinase [Bryobacter aggregatus]|uniref:sensor histidine kinase n=1 Tax=Bryobacter aggregatus TaxID=360054 RepID=UPI00068D4CFB|nr:histidine kinase [Bryobacter aggregatus]